LADKLCFNRDGYGAKNGHEKIRRHFENAKKRKIEKFYVEVDHDDPRFAELEDPFQKFNGVSAKGTLVKKDKTKWMQKRNFG
jgi:hypothetical protein